MPKAASHSRMRLLQHRVEHRREVAGRGIDDPQHLGGRGLLLQRLARLGDQPRVLHRDDRLRREILQQRDLLVGERPHLLAIDAVITPSSASSLRSGTDEHACGRRRDRPARGRSGRLAIASSAAIIGDVDERLARSLIDAVIGPGSGMRAARIGNSANACRHPVCSHRAEALAVIGRQVAEGRAAQTHAPFPASRRTPARGRRARN